MGVSAEKRAEFTVRGSSQRIECAQLQRESLVETPLESNGPAEKPCLRRLRAAGKQWKHTKDSEHGGETLSHVPIIPSVHPFWPLPIGNSPLRFPPIMSERIGVLTGGGDCPGLNANTEMQMPNGTCQFLTRWFGFRTFGFLSSFVIRISVKLACPLVIRAGVARGKIVCRSWSLMRRGIGPDRCSMRECPVRSKSPDWSRPRSGRSGPVRR